MVETPVRFQVQRVGKGQPQSLKGGIDSHLVSLSELSPTEVEYDCARLRTPDSTGLQNPAAADFQVVCLFVGGPALVLELGVRPCDLDSGSGILGHQGVLQEFLVCVEGSIYDEIQILNVI